MASWQPTQLVANSLPNKHDGDDDDGEQKVLETFTYVRVKLPSNKHIYGIHRAIMSYPYIVGLQGKPAMWVRLFMVMSKTQSNGNQQSRLVCQYPCCSSMAMVIATYPG